MGTGLFQWSIGTNGTIGTNRKGCHCNGSNNFALIHKVQTPYEIVSMNIPRSIGEPHKTISLSHRVETR